MSAKITYEDAEHIDQIQLALKSTMDRFSCGGDFELPASLDAALFYEIEGTRNAGILALPANEADVTALFTSCKASSHGQGPEKVYDENVRLARELPASRFALVPSVAEAMDVSIFNTVSMATNRAVRAVLYKVVAFLRQEACLREVLTPRASQQLNVYGPGGFFTWHQDTPKSEDHLGTVVVCLPSQHVGGELEVKHIGQKVWFDWGNKLTQNQRPIVQWAFFYSDVPHQVLPVTSGYRVTLAYDIFASPEDTSILGYPKSTFDATRFPIYTKLTQTFANRSFLTQGAKLAFALRHEYPLTKGDFAHDFARYLKGEDAILFHVLVAAGCDPIVKSVFRGEFDQEDNSDNKGDEPIDSSKTPPRLDQRDWEVSTIAEMTSETLVKELANRKLLTEGDIDSLRQRLTDSVNGEPEALRVRQEAIDETPLLTEASKRKYGPWVDCDSPGDTEVFFLGSNFLEDEGDVMWTAVDYGEAWDTVMQEAGAKVGFDHVWVLKPSLDQGWTRGPAYPTYGNEPSANTVYISVALIVELKPSSERSILSA